MTNQEQYDMVYNIYEMTVRKMTNKEWVDFLVQQFDVSRTTARNMLHGLMKMKKYDNINKMFRRLNNEI